MSTLPAPIPAASVYRLTVLAVGDVGPRMRRVTLGADELADFACLPGQDVALHLADGGAGGVSRRYTVRHLDAAQCRFDLDVVTHGDGPGARWAGTVSVGDDVEAFGPRGKIVPASARWQLFAGDESAIAAIAEMVAALSEVEATVIVEVTDADDEQPIAATGTASVRWLHRGGIAPDESRLIDDALGQLSIPGSDRHAFVFGESRSVRRLRDLLYARGLTAAEVSAAGSGRADE